MYLKATVYSLINIAIEKTTDNDHFPFLGNFSSLYIREHMSESNEYRYQNVSD